MSVAVVYNKSIENAFIGMAEKLRDETESAGMDCMLLDNIALSCLNDNQIKFDKCVYFDKDAVQGLRLELLGVSLFNNIGAIELCDDKRKCWSFIKNDFPVPETICYPLLFRSDEDFFNAFAKQVAEKLFLPLVAKSAFGSWGEQVFLLSTVRELIDYQKKNWNIPHLYTRYIKESYGRDLRVYVVGDKVCGSMLRENKTDFRSNIACGGFGRAFSASAETEKLAVELCRFLSLDFCGIDFLFSENGPVVCEVNSNAMFTTIDSVCGVNIAAEIAGHVLKSRKTEDFDFTGF